MRSGFIALLGIAVSSVSLPSVTRAQALDRLQVANDLGNVLASEGACNLTYDQDAISAWVDENVDPGDLGFASRLSLMIDGAKYTLQGMSASARTAHCRAVERSARHYRFIE